MIKVKSSSTCAEARIDVHPMERPWVQPNLSVPEGNIGERLKSTRVGNVPTPGLRATWTLTEMRLIQQPTIHEESSA